LAYSVKITPNALRQLKKISKSNSIQIISKIESILDDPLSHMIQLKGGNLYRLRVGDYRVIMSVDHGLLLILVLEVGHRKNIYKNM
jgi:mRNA interferase RelE/StbE